MRPGPGPSIRCAAPSVSFQDAFPPWSCSGNVPDSLQREAEADGERRRRVVRVHDRGRRCIHDSRRRYDIDRTGSVVIVAIRAVPAMFVSLAVPVAPVSMLGERTARGGERGRRCADGKEELLEHRALHCVMAMLISRAKPLKVNAESATAVTAC